MWWSFRILKKQISREKGFKLQANDFADKMSVLHLPAGGTLRIYADSLKPNIPYKTILLSTRDTADFAVVEALEKYGLEKENPREYCIARVTILILLYSFNLQSHC